MAEVRLIDANALPVTTLTDGGYWQKDVVYKADIDAAPTITPESLVVHGQWNGEGDGYADGEIVLDVWHCSECDYCIDDGTDDVELLPNYCPNCGAKMDLKD